MNQTFKHITNIVLIKELAYTCMDVWMDVGPSKYRRYDSSTDEVYYQIQHTTKCKHDSGRTSYMSTPHQTMVE